MIIVDNIQIKTLESSEFYVIQMLDYNTFYNYLHKNKDNNEYAWTPYIKMPPYVPQHFPSYGKAKDFLRQYVRSVGYVLYRCNPTDSLGYYYRVTDKKHPTTEKEGAICEYDPHRLLSKEDLDKALSCLH